MWNSRGLAANLIVVFAALLSPYAMSPAGTAAAEEVLSADLRLVALRAPSSEDVTATLPTPMVDIGAFATFYVELWARTSEPDGLSQVSADISFDPAMVSVNGITHTDVFSLWPTGTIDNGNGLVDDLSGSHPPAILCGDAVGFAPNWARAAVIEMQGLSPGAAQIQTGPTGDGVHFVAICGSAEAPLVAYEGVSFEVGQPVPAVSQWGAIVMSLLSLSAGTVILKQQARHNNGRSRS